LLGIWLHSSCNAVSSSLTFLGKVERFLMRLSSSDHKCSINQSFLSIHQFRRFSLCRSVSKGLDVGMREKKLISCKFLLIVLVETSSPVLSLNSFLSCSADFLLFCLTTRFNTCLCSKFKSFGRPLRGWVVRLFLSRKFWIVRLTVVLGKPSVLDMLVFVAPLLKSPII